MKRRTITFSLIALAAFSLVVATTRMAKPPTVAPCSDAWFVYIEKEYDASPSDEEGHGPDFGDPSWFSSFEYQAGIPNTSGRLPDQRCLAIQQQLERRTIVVSRLFGAITLWR
ncbi:hypothetical protein [Paludibacterium sp. B53371]|uniref:hypothetical protein n=1 Tax=Paludibacterium sp. B53371 TaxID=2806263 RepID=UPI001C055682|nr:hypothetical protein [Paludibacterium sp. B53371]